MTPGHLELRRKPTSTVNVPGADSKGVAYVVSLSRAGYKDTIVPIESTLTGRTFLWNWVWVHPLFWAIGLAVDFSTGAGYELTPSSIFVDLQPATDAPPEKVTLQLRP